MKRKKGKIVLLVILAVIAGMVFYVVNAAKKASKAAPFVTVTTAARGDLQDSILVSGTILTEKKLVVFSKVNGLIDQVNAKVGREVKAGEMLVTYQLKDAETAMTQAELQQTRNKAAYDKAMAGNKKNQDKLNEANVNLEVLKQQISDCEGYMKKLQEELSESQRIAGNQLVSQSYDLRNRAKALEKELAELKPDSKEYKEKAEELEEISQKLAQIELQQQLAGNSDYVAETQQKIAKVQEEIAGFKEYEAEMKSQKSASEAQILDSFDKKQMEADNALAEISFEETKEQYQRIQEGVPAAFDGVITECNALPGAMVSQGMQLLTLESNQDLMVEITVSRNHLEKLEIGQKAQIQVGGNKYSGQISEIDHVALSSMSGSALVRVEVHIDNPGPDLVLGLEAKVEIYTRKSENALTVPLEAVNADRNGDFVYVLKDGVIEKKTVVCGITADMSIEILEGITEADQVVLGSNKEIREGMAAMVMPEK